jgi:hypothetical protein
VSLLFCVQWLLDLLLGSLCEFLFAVFFGLLARDLNHTRGSLQSHNTGKSCNAAPHVCFIHMGGAHAEAWARSISTLAQLV